MIRITTVAATLVLSLVALFGLTLALQPTAFSASPQDVHIVDSCSQSSLESALAVASSGDTIWLRCKSNILVPARITLTSEKVIDKSLTIRGMNEKGGWNALDADGSSRVFKVNAGNTLTLTEIALQNGQASSSPGGGCIHAAGSLVVISGTLTHCRAEGLAPLSGGAIYATGTNVRLTNTTLFSNTATGSGGGLYNSGQMPVIEGSLFDSNYAGQDGGGLYLSNQFSLPRVEDTRILRNQAGGAGGGIYNASASLWLADSIVSHNAAHSYGGGVNVELNAGGDVRNTIFSGNYSMAIGLQGGGLHNFGTLDIDGSRFTGNDSYVGGGIVNRGTVTLHQTSLDLNTADYGAGIANAGKIDAGTNLTFTKNVAFYDGGGYYNGPESGRRAIFTDVVFTGNTATNGSGGGLYAAGVAELSLDRATVTDNVMKHDGGGVYFAGALITITDSTISGNRSDGSYLIASNGGGIYITGTVQPKLDRISVSGNKVGPLGKGAGLYIGGSEATSISNSQITGNSGALAGGGLYATHSVVFFWSSLVADNSAHSGGGIYSEGASVYPWWGTVIRQNSAVNGGGIYCNDCNTIMEDSTVSGNVAEEEGGGVYMPSGSMAIQRSLLNGNRAKIGGGISSSGTGIGFYNSTLSANRATTWGGGIASDAGTVRMRHATLKDNSAPSGGAIYNGWSSNIDLENTVIADSPSGGNCAGENLRSAIYSLSTDNTCLLTGTGNLVGTPAGLTPLAWVGGSTRVHLPRVDSPLLTMIVGSDYDQHDQRLFHRPVGGGADVGAVERQDFDPLLPPLLYLPLVAKQ
jgi:fibronectin-binding autotransporter adhesin